MTFSAAESFALLRADLYGSATRKVLVLKNVVADEHGAVLCFGVDPLAQLHVLAPIADGFGFQPLKRKQVELTEWVHPTSGGRYLDLVCRSDSLTSVFSLLAEDVVSRVEAQTEDCANALLKTLQDWLELLKPAPALSEEASRGLFGELIVLRQLAERNPIYAVECWTGPDNARHDFSTPHGDIEVKTSAKEALEVTISSLWQLDEINGVPLTMLRVRVAASPTGQNIGDLIEELVSLGCHRTQLIQRLGDAGFIVGSDPDDYRFVMDEPLAAWAVGPEFPGLRTADIPEERHQSITRLNYTLSLVQAPGRLDDPQLNALLDKVIQQ